MADDTPPKGISMKYPLQEQFKGQTAIHPSFLPTQQRNPISRSYRNDYTVVIPGDSGRFLSEYHHGAIRYDTMLEQYHRERIYRSWERYVQTRAGWDERQRERDIRKDTQTAIEVIREKKDGKKRAMAGGNAPTIDCKYTERAPCALYTLVHRVERKEREGGGEGE